MASLFGIYAIVDADLSAAPLELVDDALAVGIGLVQYRAKGGVDRVRLKKMLARTRAAGALLIVNDDLDAALEADGLHLGQEDRASLDPAALRARLERRVLGISCATPQDARIAQALGADYLGAGPFATTTSKPDAGAAIGERGIRAVVEATSLPVAAIGGITLENLSEVARSGARMAALISALADRDDRRSRARALVERWSQLTRDTGV